MGYLKEISVAVVNGDKEKVCNLCKEALNRNLDPEKIMFEGLVDGINVIAEKFKNNEVFMLEVLLSANAMHAGAEIVKPFFLKKNVPRIGKVVIGTVEGDIHDIGKNLVVLMLESAGFEVIDLGANVPASKYVETLRHEKPDVLGLSALLSTAMSRMEEVIKTLEKEGLRDKVKVIIGGGPVTQDFANKIGADGYALNAGAAVDKAKELIGKK